MVRVAPVSHTGGACDRSMHEEWSDERWRGTENGVHSLTPSRAGLVRWRQRLLEALQLGVQQPQILLLLVVLGRDLLGFLSLHRLQLGVVVEADSDEGDTIAEQVDGGDLVHDDGPRKSDKQPVLDHPGDVHGESRRLPDQDKHRNVEQERHHRVQAERQKVELEGGHLHQPGILDEVPRHRQEHEARRRHVVQRGDRVERDSARVEQNLDEHQAQSLHAYGPELQHDAPHVEPRLTVRSDGDSDGDRHHVGHGLRVKHILLERYAQGIHGHRHEGLQHLDERHAEIDVGGV